eukprot:scaffold40806_cov53-Attheya_sp.AAC.4
MSAGGRAAWAGNSGRVKQKLVQLLFASNNQLSPIASRVVSANRPSTVQHAHNVVQNKAKQLDSASYTYQELRAAYLQRLQQWHPDKHHHHYSYSPTENDDDDDDNSDPSSLTAAASTDKMNSFVSTDYEDDRQQQRQQKKELFVELQEAWANYESAAKLLKRVGDGGSADANFTMFGVGCSFADSEEERKIRDAITDQACRGWFRSGLLSPSSSDVSDNNKTSDDSISTKTQDLEISSMIESLRTIPLIDDSLFSEQSTIHSDASYTGTVKDKNGATTTSRKSLVDFKPRRQSRTMSNPKSNPK